MTPPAAATLLQSIDHFAESDALRTGLHLIGWQGLFAVEGNEAHQHSAATASFPVLLRFRVFPAL